MSVLSTRALILALTIALIMALSLYMPQATGLAALILGFAALGTFLLTLTARTAAYGRIAFAFFSTLCAALVIVPAAHVFVYAASAMPDGQQMVAFIWIGLYLTVSVGIMLIMVRTILRKHYSFVGVF